MALDICSQPVSLMVPLSSPEAPLLSLHSEKLNSPLHSFHLTPWNAQVADAMAAQPSPPTVVCVPRGMSAGRLFVDDEAAGSGSDRSAPYLYECESSEFSAKDL